MLAGVDIGSTGLKVSVFSGTGERIRYAYREYSLEYRGGDQVVIDPEVWWESFCSCVEEIGKTLDLRGLRGIGVSHANAMVLADSRGKPLFPAIMQLDKRGAEMVPVLARELGNDRIFEITGNNNAAGFVWGPTLKWLWEREREAYRQVRWLLNPASYLVLRLTGAYCMDHTRAATTMLYDIRRRRWDPALCEYFHLAPEAMPRLCGGREIVGHTTGAGGLPAGIPVAAGAMDTISAVVGLSSGRQANALILGSVGRFALAAKQLDRRFLNTLTPDGGMYVSMTPVNNAGIAVKWVRDLLAPGTRGQADSFEMLNRLAGQVGPGAEGLMFFPYLNGASCPNWDNTVRGTFANIQAYHGPGHFSRAVFEGVGYTLAESLLIFLQNGGELQSLVYCGGGGAKSAVWTQILSDMLGQPLLIPEHLETETMGAAILAGQAIGALEEAVSWNRIIRTVYPNGENHRLYQELLRRFMEAYPAVRSLSQVTGQRET